MKLLHNNEVELSRALLADLPAGVEVIEGDGGYAVSAYPSVVILRPAMELYVQEFGHDGELLGMQRTAVDEREEIVRCPASWEAVSEYVQYT